MEADRPDILPTLGKGTHFNSVISKEEQRSPLPSRKDAIRCSSLDAKNYIFSEETMQSIRELGAVLQAIHNRLYAEGYVLQDGKFIKDHEPKNTN